MLTRVQTRPSKHRDSRTRLFSVPVAVVIVRTGRNKAKRIAGEAHKANSRLNLELF
jgi:hypothetical protein